MIMLLLLLLLPGWCSTADFQWCTPRSSTQECQRSQCDAGVCWNPYRPATTSRKVRSNPQQHHRPVPRNWTRGLGWLLWTLTVPQLQQGQQEGCLLCTRAWQSRLVHPERTPP